MDAKTQSTRRLEVTNAGMSLKLMKVKLAEGVVKLVQDARGNYQVLAGSLYKVPASPFRLKPFQLYLFETQIVLKKKLPKLLRAQLEPTNLFMLGFSSLLPMNVGENITFSFLPVRSQIELTVGFPVAHIFLSSLIDSKLETTDKDEEQTDEESNNAANDQ